MGYYKQKRSFGREFSSNWEKGIKTNIFLEDDWISFPFLKHLYLVFFTRTRNVELTVADEWGYPMEEATVRNMKR